MAEAIKEFALVRTFSHRTVLLMLLALVAFARLWCVTHPAPPERAPVEVIPLPLDGGARQAPHPCVPRRADDKRARA